MNRVRHPFVHAVCFQHGGLAVRIAFTYRHGPSMATLQEVASDAFPVLVDTATNRSTITYGDLAARLFYLSAYRSLYCYFFTIDTSSIALIQGLDRGLRRH